MSSLLFNEYSMNRDLLILLILKEFLNDINLCKIISNLVIDKEYSINKILHNLKYKKILLNIELLYPRYFKTATFHRFDVNNININVDGYSIYNIHPLKNSGNHLFNNKKYNGILLLNRLNKKNPDLIMRIYNKLQKYKNGINKLSVWYDFENDMFLNF